MANSPVEDADRVKRPHSIDLSLELEHQLALEEGDGGTPAHDAAGTKSSLDPHVLASIIGQLRDQIARITTERDDLLNLMSAAVAREADLKDALQDMTDKFTAAREEVASAREQHASDQENIALLRNKVEESRRGLMKLQTESRRSSVMSTMTLDLSRAGGAASNGPPTGRNSQFTPLTGSGMRAAGHRRGASIASAGIPGYTSPNTQVEEEDASRRSNSRSPPKANRRMSGLFLRSTSPNTEALSPETLEAQRLRKEVQAMRDQLEETRAELTEANEARDASETCVKALRDFIAENGIGMGSGIPGIAAPIPKSHEAKKPSTSWAFNLWRASSQASSSSASTNGPLPAIAGSPQSPDMPPPPNPPPQPLTRKLTGFFGARSSEYAPSVASTTAARDHDGNSESSAEEPEPISPELGPSPSTRLVRTDSLPEHRSPIETDPKAAIHDDQTDVSGSTVSIAVP